MIALFPEGFEERDAGCFLELAAYTERDDATAALGALGPVRDLEVARGWEDGWQRFHRPVRVGPLWIGPSWELPDADVLAVVIDPGRAFGTGAHATTRLSLELLLELEPGGLVDVGCGSGVLAVAAAKLGFAPVIALDDDGNAVEVARANAAANGVEVDVQLADALVDPLPDVRVAVANIARVPVEGVAERFGGEVVVASGYLEPERPAPRVIELDQTTTLEQATFTADFLGCKVSQTDVHEIRERLVADGHVESGESADVAIVNTCCVTHEAVRKSRQAVRRAARSARRVYVTGCGANLSGDAFGDLPENVTVVRLPGERTPEFVARDVGAIGCVRADVGLDRVRAFVKVQDGCSFSCAFCPQPGGRRSPGRGAAPRRAGPPRGGAHRDQSRLLPRPRRRVRSRSPRS